MIKRIIFDIDNTLLETTKDCLDAYDAYISKCNLNLTSSKLYKIIGEYEQLNRDYDMEDLSSFIGKEVKGFDASTLKELLLIYGTKSTLINKDTEQILKYLSSKYELVALSNWYIDSQKQRLEKVGILKYFKEIYGFENAGVKPNEQAFKFAKGTCSYDECVIIGDNPNTDIDIPNKLGMKTIWYNKESKTSDSKTINSLSYLKNIL